MKMTEEKLDLLRGGPGQGLFPFLFALISQVLLRRTMLDKEVKEHGRNET